MIASGLSVLGVLGLARYTRAERAAIEKARDWLEEIGLIDRADDPAADLPYGAQRRLEIARAMCTEPELLCLDEPAAGLNPRECAELNALSLAIRDEHATSVLLIEHDMSVVMEISDHVVVLEYGIKIADGTAGGDPQRSEGDRRLSRRRGRGGREGREELRPWSAAMPAHGVAAPRVRGVQTFYGNIIALQGRRHRRLRRRDRRADRRQRRRQVDADDDDLRQPAGARRLDHLRRPRHHADCRRTRSRGCGSRSRPRAGASFRA